MATNVQIKEGEKKKNIDRSDDYATPSTVLFSSSYSER